MFYLDESDNASLMLSITYELIPSLYRFHELIFYLFSIFSIFVEDQ